MIWVEMSFFFWSKVSPVFCAFSKGNICRGVGFFRLLFGTDIEECSVNENFSLGKFRLGVLFVVFFLLFFLLAGFSLRNVAIEVD